jgi:FdhD protein
MKPIKEVDIFRIDFLEEKSQKDCIVREVPLTIILNGKELVTLQCSPLGLKNLAVGFLLSEGILRPEGKVKEIELNERGWYIRVVLEGDSFVDLSLLSSRVIGTGCAGGVSFYRAADAKGCLPLDSEVKIQKKKVLDLMRDFQERSSLFKTTGGVHSCALCGQKEIEAFADDIGRHNAVDKVLGECFLKGISVQDKVILSSGRISSEILIKVAKQKIPIIISRSATTDLAVELAEKLRITLIGFARGKRMNIYTHRDRVD